MKPDWFRLGLIVFLAICLTTQNVPAKAGGSYSYVPIGSGDNADTLQRFAQAATAHDTNGTVDILVIPITFGTDAFSTTNGERQKNLHLANTRRGQVETACNAVKAAGQTGRAVWRRSSSGSTPG